MDKLAALNHVLAQARSAPFYQQRLPQEPLKHLRDLKRIPLTMKEDLRLHSPYGLLCVPRSELYQYHETFGTTGNPTSTWLTKEDLKDNAREVNTSGVDLNREDTVLVRFPYAISAIAHMVHTAAQMKKACVIPASSRNTISPYPRVINLMQKLEVTVLASLPMQALLLAETAELLGLNPKTDFPKLRAILTAGEPVTPGRRQILQNLWGVPIYDVYGMAEIGTAITDCEFGRPHPLEDYFVFEILREDLKTEAKMGELGYLVITTLKKRATPIIRYLTGDRARMVRQDCPCGQEYTLEVHGRRKDILTVGNQVFDLWELEGLLSHFPCRRFWIVGPIPQGLRFVIEEENPGDQVSHGLIKNLEEQYKLRLEVEIVPKGTLYDRKDLLAVGEVGKPRYIYSMEEMMQKTYLKGSKT